jgi:hypothetical protein
MINRTDNIRVNVTWRRVHVTIFAEQKHEQRMRHIGLPFVACPAVPYFSTLSHKQKYIRKKCFYLQMCVLIFSTKFV